MISRYFINRPVFASVISILITLAGGLAVFTLPIALYPEITPPTIQVICTYPGSNAEILAETVAAPIEQQVNGVEGMLYMSSQSANDGTYMLTVTFALGVDIDQAMVLVQNRVSLAMPQLPQIVQAQGVNVKKKSPDILLVVNLYSPDGRYDDLYMSNYATLHVQDPLARLDGVGDITFFGERDYSLRVWLDPERLAYREMTPGDVIRALQEQNLSAVLGQVGQPPNDQGQQIQLTMDAMGRLSTVEEFGDIIVKTDSSDQDRFGPTPRVVYLKDIAQVELGAKSEQMSSTLDGMPSVGLALFQLPGANALQVGNEIREKMEELKVDFPAGLDYAIVYDTTPFTRESIQDVFQSMVEAILLVAAVVLLFLQNWRATIIPLVAIPVAIVGTFAVMAVIGFSLNMLSLFGLVLAVGIVVDDAIVVVENVQRWLEQGYSPKEAACRAMDEVTGPIVAVALVLSAVFVPCAFISGITGEFFRQFAVTIAVSTLFSAFNSLTLSPMLASRLLKTGDGKPDMVTRVVDFLAGWFFRLFNRGFTATSHFYARVVTRFVRLSVFVLVFYVGLLGLTAWANKEAPQGFIPLQDKGYLLVNVQMPPGASMSRTGDVLHTLEKQFHEVPGVAHTISITGRSILVNANSSHYGTLFVVLDPFSERKTLSKNGLVMLMKLRNEYPGKLNEAVVQVLPPPPVSGLGVAGGFELMIENRGNLPQQELQTITQNVINAAMAESNISDAFTLRESMYPSTYLDIDRTHARAMGVPVAEVSQTLQATTGSVYVNDFNRIGRTWQVNVQAEADYRSEPDNIGQYYVRGLSQGMAPLASMLRADTITGPPIVFRYNLYEAAPVMGRAQAGTSSGAALATLDQVTASVLPSVMQSEWTGLSYLQVEAGNTALYVFGMSVIFVFLVLAALYESWSLPLAIIMVVPLGILFAILGVWAFPFMNVDIFTQIGFVVLVGLGCKNAVLIVEFAHQLQGKGQPLFEATIEASRLRLRPIVMTSCAFLLGVVPLIIATGAGAEMRRALGVAMFCGMLGVSIFGVFFTPVFYYVIRWCSSTRLLSNVVVQGVGTLVLGPVVGGTFGLLLGRTQSISFWWAMLSGVAAGLLTSGVVLGRRRIRRRMNPDAPETENPDGEPA